MEGYEEYEEYEESGGGVVNRILLVVIGVLVVAVGVVGFFLIKNMRSKDTSIGLALLPLRLMPRREQPGQATSRWIFRTAPSAKTGSYSVAIS